MQIWVPRKQDNKLLLEYLLYLIRPTSEYTVLMCIATVILVSELTELVANSHK
jgi:hypothetical protein